MRQEREAGGRKCRAVVIRETNQHGMRDVVSGGLEAGPGRGGGRVKGGRMECGEG